MRLAWRDLRASPGRYLVIALGIALGTAIMVGSATSRMASTQAVEGTIDAYSGGAAMAWSRIHALVLSASSNHNLRLVKPLAMPFMSRAALRVVTPV
jgi:hypothetical protein